MFLFFALRPHDLAMISAHTGRNLVHSIDASLIVTSGGPVVFDTPEAMVLMKAQSDMAVTDVSILLAIENLAWRMNEPHYAVQSCIICTPDRILLVQLIALLLYIYPITVVVILLLLSQQMSPVPSRA